MQFRLRTNPLVSVSLVLIVLILASCGFRLRGTGILPESLQRVVLVCQPNNANNLCAELRNQLSIAGIEIIDGEENESAEDSEAETNREHSKGEEDREGENNSEGKDDSEDSAVKEDAEQETPSAAADATLVIAAIKDKRRAASIASDASTAEIEFSRSVDFEVRSADLTAGRVKMTANQFQTYQYTELSVLGKEKEEEQVIANLNRLLATEILNRSASAISLAGKNKDN